ncbi:15818_t:CDS:1, partial [Racocetra fulgida]
SDIPSNAIAQLEAKKNKEISEKKIIEYMQLLDIANDNSIKKDLEIKI